MTLEAAERLDTSTALELLPDPVVVVDDHVRLLWGNQAAADTFGWTLDELAGRDVSGLVHPDDMWTAMASLQSVREKTVGTLVEIRLRTRDGLYRSFEVRGRSAIDDPRIGGTLLVLRDVSERHGWTIAGGDVEALRAVLDRAPGITIILTEDGEMRGATRALSARLGRSLEMSLGRNIRSLVHPDDREVVEAGLVTVREAGTATIEIRMLTAGGESIPTSMTITNLLDDVRIRGLVATATDISELAASRARLEHLATHDDLTGLPNRGAFLQTLNHEVAVARSTGRALTLVFCDIDEFKEINDSFGHVAGDELLRQIGRRLAATTRKGDRLARFGGDEFVILVRDAEPSGVVALTNRIAALGREPVELDDDNHVYATLTTGCATLTAAMDATDLLQAADTAMYARKHRH